MSLEIPASSTKAQIYSIVNPCILFGNIPASVSASFKKSDKDLDHRSPLKCELVVDSFGGKTHQPLSARGDGDGVT